MHFATEHSASNRLMEGPNAGEIAPKYFFDRGGQIIDKELKLKRLA